MDKFLNKGLGLIKLGFLFLLFVFSAFAVTGITTAIVLSAKSDCQIDYCYITHTSGTIPYYSLKGHRKWCSNNSMGEFITFEEAKSKADSINCPIK